MHLLTSDSAALKHLNLTIATAKTRQPDSASSQFFINVAENSNRYASFDSTTKFLAMRHMEWRLLTQYHK
jgi:cyclophilin family peptidyl-prolyl cis-trans isomerase